MHNVEKGYNQGEIFRNYMMPHNENGINNNESVLVAKSRFKIVFTYGIGADVDLISTLNYELNIHCNYVISRQFGFWFKTKIIKIFYALAAFYKKNRTFVQFTN